MSAVQAPPSDLAPRVLSNDPGDHDVPHGREEEWRFTPIDKIRDFFAPGDWGTVSAASGEFVSVCPASADTSAVESSAEWVATDLPSALARTRAADVVSIDIPAEAQVADVIVVDSRLRRRRTTVASRSRPEPSRKPRSSFGWT